MLATWQNILGSLMVVILYTEKININISSHSRSLCNRDTVTVTAPNHKGILLSLQQRRPEQKVTTNEHIYSLTTQCTHSHLFLYFVELLCVCMCVWCIQTTKSSSCLFYGKSEWTFLLSSSSLFGFFSCRIINTKRIQHSLLFYLIQERKKTSKSFLPDL